MEELVSSSYSLRIIVIGSRMEAILAKSLANLYPEAPSFLEELAEFRQRVCVSYLDHLAIGTRNSADDSVSDIKRVRSWHSPILPDQ